MDYHMSVSGTGQNTAGWCKGIRDNMKGECGGNFNLHGQLHCNTRNASSATFYTNPDNGALNYVYGIETWFTIQAGWASTLNSNHTLL